ncbi:adenine deaminase [Lutispora sp.]|uniref:adenine deaminase n=1 Tax=Lutispora sp. TaxID=2828727 RepID=UPI002B1F07A0|nr:adenine deaminase [Lutispora sp.]MEA4961861.1 adenine deaminase [Lutispora sp.]
MREIITALIDVAAGRAKAQIVFKNINIVNVFTGEIIKADVAVHDGYIAGIGEYEGAEEYDMEGKFLCPGFIDSHMHIESTMVTPGEFARAVTVRGTTGIIADPHEIANVKGIAGIKYMLEGTENLPIDVYIMLPSCVPATPFENSGSILKAEDLLELINHPRVLGLGELMDFENVINCEKTIINKIVLCQNSGKFVDGHGPGLSGRAINAYAASGVRTEHECTTPEEAVERLRLGMHIMLREGSAAKNLVDLLPALNNSSISRCMFCTDDRHPEDILKQGHIDNNVRLAIKNGVDPVTAVQMATINVARCYNLHRVGGIAPGYKADLLILNDLKSIDIYQVYKNGKLIAENNEALFDIFSINDSKMRNSVNIKELEEDSFQIKNDHGQLRIIGLVPNSLITKTLISEVVKTDGKYYSKDGEELLKIAVIERHNATGNIGLGLVSGLGLKDGAIASSVAHDSHNIVVIGDNDRDMKRAVEKLEEIGGGVAIASGGEIIKYLSLPIAGLMSDSPIEKVQSILADLIETAYKMGVNKDYDPSMTLSFLALPVIPEIKLTDLGLFDVNNFKFVSINV